MWSENELLNIWMGDEYLFEYQKTKLQKNKYQLISKSKAFLIDLVSKFLQNNILNLKMALRR